MTTQNATREYDQLELARLQISTAGGAFTQQAQVHALISIGESLQIIAGRLARHPQYELERERAAR